MLRSRKKRAFLRIPALHVDAGTAKTGRVRGRERGFLQRPAAHSSRLGDRQKRPGWCRCETGPIGPCAGECRHSKQCGRNSCAGPARPSSSGSERKTPSSAKPSPKTWISATLGWLAPLTSMMTMRTNRVQVGLKTTSVRSNWRISCKTPHLGPADFVVADLHGIALQGILGEFRPFGEHPHGPDQAALLQVDGSDKIDRGYGRFPSGAQIAIYGFYAIGGPPQSQVLTAYLLEHYAAGHAADIRAAGKTSD